MRQAPKCQGLLSWRGLRSGRNQDPVGALLRSRRPPCRRALACLRSRCLRVKAAEKDLQTTTPLTANFWVTAEGDATWRAPFKYPATLSWKADASHRGDCDSRGPKYGEYRRTQGTQT